MKVGIDISQMAFAGTGVASYTQNLVRSLLEIDKKNDYRLFFSSLRRKPPAEFKSVNLRFPPTFLEVLWNRLHVLPIERFLGRVDVFHSSDWLEPPTQCPKVTTVHDLVVFRYPQTLHPKIVKNQRRKLEWVRKETNLIIAVSESTKRDLVEILKISPKKIRVIYEATDPLFQKRLSPGRVNTVKKKYQLKKNYLLAVGTREPRKNLKKVIEAFELLGRKDLDLVIAGKFGWGEDIKMANGKILGYVPKEDLPGLYTAAEVFVYPSLYEGFGLPVLEAMACGVPVVTSNTSSLPEVAGKAGVLVNPQESEAIAGGIEKALDQASELREKGFKQAQKFSWKKTAEQTLAVYREVYVNRH